MSPEASTPEWLKWIRINLPWWLIITHLCWMMTHRSGMSYRYEWSLRCHMLPLLDLQRQFDLPMFHLLEDLVQLLHRHLQLLQRQLQRIELLVLYFIRCIAVSYRLHHCTHTPQAHIHTHTHGEFCIIVEMKHTLYIIIFLIFFFIILIFFIIF